MRLLITMLFFCTAVVSGWAASPQPAGQLLPEQEVKAAVLQAVHNKVAGRGWDVRLNKINLPAGIRLPAGVREFELVAPRQWDGWGTSNLTLLVRVNGRIERNISLRVELEAMADMVVASRQIAAGAVLLADDLTMLKQDVALTQGRFIASLDEAVGKKSRVTIRQNAPLRSDQLDRVPVIKSGQLVTIVAESASIKITASGRARSSGGIGDLIMVQNLGSAKEFPAKVLDASSVLIGF